MRVVVEANPGQIKMAGRHTWIRIRVNPAPLHARGNLSNCCLDMSNLLVPPEGLLIIAKREFVLVVVVAR